MPMSINHLTFVISIQKLDTVFVGTNAETGYEIRSYDEYAFMREIGAYLDTEDGIVLDDVFEHFTNQILSGVDYARIFKMLSPYTITVEDGAYQVKLNGGTNTNFLDVLNPNNVSVIPENSAGKQLVSSSSGLLPGDTDDIADAVANVDISNLDDMDTLGGAVSHLKHLEYKLFIDTELVNPTKEDGSQHFPFASETPAIDYAEGHGILNLRIKSDITLSRDVYNFYIDSINIAKVDTNDRNVNGCRFSYIELTGDYTGRITAQDCSLTGTTTLNGYFDNCALGSDFTIPNNGFAFISDTKALVSDLTPPTISLAGVSGTAILNMMGYKGGANILHCNQPTDNVKIELDGGRIILDASCTDGQIRITGHGTVIDNSTVTDIIISLLEPEKLNGVHAAEMNRRKSVGLVDTIYEDDGITARQEFDITKDGNGEVIEIVPR